MPRRVAFRFCHPFAGSVTLAGDFNEWSTMANPMTYDPTCRCWSTTVELGPGRYEYKFFVDGTQWWNDPDAPKVPNVWGSENSYLDVEQRATMFCRENHWPAQYLESQDVKIKPQDKVEVKVE